MIHSVQCFLSSIKLRRKIFLGGIFIVLLFPQKVSHAQTQTGSFEFEGRTRDYIVSLPDNFRDTTNFPLVIYLHGYDWTAEIEIDYTLMNLVADTSGFIVVFPNAVDRRWNSGIGEDAAWPTPDIDDVGFINALIDTLSNHYSINLERIYACGLSNGGFMSYKLACQLSHRIAAIASVGGVISSGTADNCNPQHTMPVLQIHGTADGLVSLYGTTDWYSVDQTLSYWTDFNGCVQVDTVLLPDLDPTDGCTVEKITYSNCSDESNVIFYKVIHGGHNWPDATADYSWAGKKTKDINAGVEILNFFKNYELVTSIEATPNSTPGEFCLFQNYPNPFNTETTILYQLPELLNVKLVIYNLLGQSIAILKDEEQSAGTYSVQWDGKDGTGKQLPRGVYLYRLETMEFSEVKKLTLQR